MRESYFNFIPENSHQLAEKLNVAFPINVLHGLDYKIVIENGLIQEKKSQRELFLLSSFSLDCSHRSNNVDFFYNRSTAYTSIKFFHTENYKLRKGKNAKKPRLKQGCSLQELFHLPYNSSAPGRIPKGGLMPVAHWSPLDISHHFRVTTA